MQNLVGERKVLLHARQTVGRVCQGRPDIVTPHDGVIKELHGFVRSVDKQDNLSYFCVGSTVLWHDKNIPHQGIICGLYFPGFL